MAGLKKGQTRTLNVTHKARHRVFAGLSWDPNEKAGLLARARELTGGPKSWHDLDLSCFLYDINGNFIECITAAQASDRSGYVYHSGDSVEGIGDGDDEQISAELRDLPPKIHQLVFTAWVKSGHGFSEIGAPEIRLADGYTDHDFLKVPLNQKDSAGKSVFVFARLFRDVEGWSLQNISAFANFGGEPETWTDEIRKYLE